jgi:hypothetical protein
MNINLYEDSESDNENKLDYKKFKNKLDEEEENEEFDSDEKEKNDEDKSEEEEKEEEEEEEEEEEILEIIEDINSDDDEEKEMKIKKKQKLEKKKKKEKEEEDIGIESIQEGKPKTFKPLQYDKLKEKNSQKGIIFVAKPPNKYNSTDQILKYFSQFGIVTRVHQHNEVKFNKKYVTGYYVEFEKKSIAKRVALTINMTQMEKSLSHILMIRYEKNFNWNDLENVNFYF